jgi:hypothetical protein
MDTAPRNQMELEQLLFAKAIAGSRNIHGIFFLLHTFFSWRCMIRAGCFAAAPHVLSVDVYVDGVVKLGLPLLNPPCKILETLCDAMSMDLGVGEVWGFSKHCKLDKRVCLIGYASEHLCTRYSKKGVS